MKLIGVDGCRAGWVAASSDMTATGATSLSDLTFSIAPTFDALLASLRGQRALVAVDIPIGLPSGRPRDDGRRRADAAARAFLGPRRASSVFSAPSRPALGAESYREACELAVSARGSGRGLSQQTYRIIPKIRDVDRAVRPEHQKPVSDGLGIWVREVHPEVVFAALAGEGGRGHGLVHAKRGCARCVTPPCPGEDDRLALLRRYVPDFDPRAVRQRLLREHPREEDQRAPVVGRDDIVDAVACVVSALRILTGTALTLPAGDPEFDARGLRMEILA